MSFAIELECALAFGHQQDVVEVETMRLRTGLEGRHRRQHRRVDQQLESVLAPREFDSPWLEPVPTAACHH